MGNFVRNIWKHHFNVYIQHGSRAYEMVAILYKRGGPRCYFQNSLLTMGRGKDLTEEEKSTIIKEIATGNAQARSLKK